jgi:amino acid transporter/Trk K+ transport system NAD-binding subunit
MCEIEENKKLQKKLTLLDVIALATGTTLSAGFFLLPGLAALQVGPGIMFAYIIAAIPLIPATFSIVELTTAMPRAGGVYYYLDRALGPVFGTIGGVGTWFALILKVAFALIGMGVYLALFFPQIEIIPVAIIIAVCLGILNIAGSQSSGKFQVILVIGLLIILAGFIGGGFYKFEINHFNGLKDLKSDSLLATAAMVYISYVGVTSVASLSEEVKDPERNLPRGIFLALLIAIIIYALGTTIMVGVIPMEKLAGDLTPVATAANIIFGKIGVLFVSVAALLAFVSVANAGTMSASRYPLAMSRDNMMPGIFQQLGRTGMPYISIIFTVIMIIFILIFLDITKIVKLASAFQLIMFLILCFAVIVMRESRIESYDPGYKSPLYPWMQIFGIISSFWLLSSIGFIPKLFSVIMIAISVIWYRVYVKKRVLRSGAIFNMFENLGKSRNENLDRELRGILKEKGLRKDDPFDELVTRSSVVDIQDKTEFEDIVDIVSKKFSDILHIYEDEVKKPFLEGTRVGNTPVTKEVALPHFRLKNISQMEMIIVRARNGVEIKFKNPLKGFKEEVQIVKAIFFLISPENNANLHLRILAQVAGVVDDKQFQEYWSNAADEQELKEILIHDERYLSVNLDENSKLVGMKIKNIELPDKCLIAIIKRENEIVVPDGDTVFKYGDKVTVIGEPLSIVEFQKLYISA